MHALPEEKNKRGEAPPLSLRSFGLRFFCPPLPPSLIFISLSCASAGLEALSRTLCSSLLSGQENQRKETRRAVGEEGQKVSEEENTFLLLLPKLFLVEHQ